MKVVSTISVICAISAAALADGNLPHVNGVGYAEYNVATGQITAGPGYGWAIWEMTNQSGTYCGSMDWREEPDLGALVVDWGDLGDPNYPAFVGDFEIAYGTDLTAPATIDCEILFYGDYDGFNNNGFYPLSGFHLSELPTATGAYNSWVIFADLDVDPNDPACTDRRFRITGNDIDGDRMTDFGYSYWFPSLSGSDSKTGPLIVNPDLTIYPTVAAAEAALGVSEGYDAYAPDPNDPNTFVFAGTWWFGGWDPNDPNDPNHPYSQFYLSMFEITVARANPCWLPGDSGMYCSADIDRCYGDCVVGLADLAKLLSYYGMTEGASHYLGDLDSDGDVDLSDLAAMLAQYGDDCNY